jgi:putative transposase
MDEFESLNHTKWDCKYHIVFIPKGRKKALFGPIRRDLGEVLRRLAEQKECRVLEGHLMPDHVHMLVSIPPKYAVSSVVGYIKGKSAIYLARTYGERQRNFAGMNFWARGYFVSTVGRDEKMIRDYIQNQGLLAVWRGLRPANPCLRLRLAPPELFLGSAGKGRFFVPA